MLVQIEMLRPCAVGRKAGRRPADNERLCTLLISIIDVNPISEKLDLKKYFYNFSDQRKLTLFLNSQLGLTLILER